MNQLSPNRNLHIDPFRFRQPKGLALSGTNQHDWALELKTGTVNYRSPEFTDPEMNTKIDNTFKVFVQLLSANFGLKYNFIDLKIIPSSAGGFINNFCLYMDTGKEIDGKPVIKNYLTVSLLVDSHGDTIQCKMKFNETVPNEFQEKAKEIFQNVSQANDLNISFAA